MDEAANGVGAAGVDSRDGQRGGVVVQVVLDVVELLEDVRDVDLDAVEFRRLRDAEHGQQGRLDLLYDFLGYREGLPPTRRAHHDEK